MKNYLKSELISRKNDILITTGLLKIDLLEKMKKSFFTKKTSNIYFRDFFDHKIFSPFENKILIAFIKVI